MDRVKVLSRRIETWELRRGDHIYARRRKLGVIIYMHHGIYESHQKVIHFLSSADTMGSSSSLAFTVCASCRNGGGCASTMRGGGVVACCLECFLEGDDLRLFAYGVPWWFFNCTNAGVGQDNCSMEAEDPADEVLRRANHGLRHGGFGGGYHVALNNCFDFAYYCKTGCHYVSAVDVVRDVAHPLRPSPYSFQELRSTLRRWLF
uniref:LRAT domain-containing protein n=1 Tax=Oryza brachyantha TaxID=4533 RepID=J3NE46_ORYBR